MRCSSCGAEASGKFCSECGAPLSNKKGCPNCGRDLKPGAAFCSHCGEPTAPRASKPLRAHLPWVISFVALAAFAFLIAWFVQQQSRARIGDDPITGGLPEPSASAGGEAGAGAGGMPDLSTMSAREAADRLFDRAMREEEAGNEGQASQFANMALQAYGSVPPEQIDLDALFHVGLLHLLMGDSNTATSIAEGILADDESHLLALLLARRAAVAVGDMAAADGYSERLRTAVEAGLIDEAGRPEYQAHRGLIEREAGVSPAASPGGAEAEGAAAQGDGPD